MFLEEEQSISSVIGVDEVGRGPLAGPVVACGVFYQGSPRQLASDVSFLSSLKVTDSKKLTAKKRLQIISDLGIEEISVDRVSEVSSLKGSCLFVLKECSEKIIDDINILQASLLAMKKCVLSFSYQQETRIWLDGNKTPRDLHSEHLSSIVKGDSKSFSIGLASIIAKVYRDRLMSELSRDYPHFGFEKNSGYPTKLHIEALKKYGASPIHRKTFKGVKELL